MPDRARANSFGATCGVCRQEFTFRKRTELMCSVFIHLKLVNVTKSRVNDARSTPFATQIHKIENSSTEKLNATTASGIEHTQKKNIHTTMKKKITLKSSGLLTVNRTTCAFTIPFFVFVFQFQCLLLFYLYLLFFYALDMGLLILYASIKLCAFTFFVFCRLF